MNNFQLNFSQQRSEIPGYLIDPNTKNPRISGFWILGIFKQGSGKNLIPLPFPQLNLMTLIPAR